MKFNEKTKKALTIGGCVVIGAALIAAIGLQFPKAPAQTDILPPASTQSAEVTVAPPETPPTAESTPSSEEKEVVIQPNTTVPESSQAVDSRPAQTDQTEQSIQPEATKPVVTEEQKKDQTQKPNGEKVTEEPEVVDHDTYTPSDDVPRHSDEPQGGETNASGQTYFPGFGWVDGTGDVESTELPDMYENGNKIGEMGN